MEITVIDGGGSETTLQVESGMTVFDLKVKIRALHRFLIDDEQYVYELYFGDTCLGGWDPLEGYDGAQLKRSIWGFPSQQELLNGTRKLTEECNVNLMNMKFILGDETQAPSTVQKLLLGRKTPNTCVLENDDATLGDLGINAKSYVKFRQNEN